MEKRFCIVLHLAGIFYNVWICISCPFFPKMEFLSKRLEETHCKTGIYFRGNTLQDWFIFSPEIMLLAT
jgi:hypothetical protein